MNETAGLMTLPLTKTCAAVGADRHRRQLQRLPVDGAPDGNPAVLLDDLVGAHRVADRNVTDNAGANVPPDWLHIVALREPNHRATLEGLGVLRDPCPFDHTDDVVEIEGAMCV
ncbi:MAG: hypothetical protein KIT00_12255 [Rhodospirillales bacterium]|nr:hypothetical protein [Rhodospirillales bacterium]